MNYSLAIYGSNFFIQKIPFSKPGLLVLKELGKINHSLVNAINNHYHIIVPRNNKIISRILTRHPDFKSDLKFVSEKISDTDLFMKNNPQFLEKPGFLWNPDLINQGQLHLNNHFISFIKQNEKIISDYVFKMSIENNDNLIIISDLIEKSLIQ